MHFRGRWKPPVENRRVVRYAAVARRTQQSGDNVDGAGCSRITPLIWYAADAESRYILRGFNWSGRECTALAVCKYVSGRDQFPFFHWFDSTR